MMIDVYEPPKVDPDLTRFAAQLDALKRQGVSVARYNLNSGAAARTYRDRVIGPVHGVLPEATVRTMEETE